MKEVIEQIVDSVKKVGRKAIAPILISTILAGTIKADGYLNIDNYVGSTIGTSPARAMHYDSSGISDGYDSSWDVSAILPMSGRCSIYSDIGTNKLRTDFRLTDSNLPFDLKLVYNGTLTSDANNVLEFSFLDENYTFDANDQIHFESDRLPYGPVVDIRRAISDNDGNIPLIDLAAGTYSNSTPYGSGILTIGTRLLSDLDDSNEVNLKDFARFANDWQQSQGQYTADIAGPNGIPDSYVNYYDLDAFSDDWLKDVNSL